MMVYGKLHAEISQWFYMNFISKSEALRTDHMPRFVPIGWSTWPTQLVAEKHQAVNAKRLIFKKGPDLIRVVSSDFCSKLDVCDLDSICSWFLLPYLT